MKKLWVLILAMTLLLLAACSEAAPEKSGANTSTQAQTTTEPETTTDALFLPSSGVSEGVRWRKVDLADEANAALKEELLRRQNEPEQTEFQMGSKTILVSYEKIEMADKNGKRTVLLEIDKIDKNDEMRWRYPKFSAMLDDRYFLYIWMGWSWGISTGIYDTKEMKEIKIIDDVLNTVKVQGDYIYYVDAWDEEDYDGPPHLYAYDWTAIKRGKPVMGVDLLEGFNGPDAIFLQRLLTDDLRYYLALEEGLLRIYDLKDKKLLTTLPEPDPYSDRLEEWNGKVYWIHWNDPDCAFEISLP